MMRAMLRAAALLAPLTVMAGEGTCTRVADVCVQGPQTRVISGQSVTRD